MKGDSYLEINDYLNLFFSFFFFFQKLFSIIGFFFVSCILPLEVGTALP